MRHLSGTRLVLATHNAGKLSEIGELLAPFQVECVGAGELGLAVPEETEDSFEGNALIKARYAMSKSRLPAMADDSGLEIDALGGKPGVHSADWAEFSSGRDFGKAMHRVHGELLLSGKERPWLARFHCVLAIVWPDGFETTFHGLCEGQIVWPMRGLRGHGYDPIFLPAGMDKTFGELDGVVKNRISHRFAAFERLKRVCFT